MRVLVCGSRDFSDRGKVIEQLILFAGLKDIVIVHGCARGADRLAHEVATQLGFTVEQFPADWSKYGKSAGFRRNQQMLDSGVDGVLAFKSRAISRGTDDMIGRCKAAGVPGVIFTSTH